MPSNLLDRLNKIKATKAAAIAKPTVPVRGAPAYKPKATPGKLFGAPFTTSGPLGDATEAVSILKVAAYLAGRLPADQVKGQIEFSDRIKAVYGPLYQFQDPFRSMLVPASTKFMPLRTDQGYEIPGAIAICKEAKQRLAAGVVGYDPEEVAHIRKQVEIETKALNTMNDTAGGSLVPPPELRDLIDLQRNLEVFSNAGCTNVDLPPQGRAQYPKLTGGATAGWVGETVATTESQEVTGVLNLEAKYLYVRVPLTQQLMRFSSTSVEGMVRMDMARQGALKADLAMLEGTGGTQIKGLTTYPTATSWSQNTDKLLSYSVTANTFQPEDVENMEGLLPDSVEATAWVMRKNMWPKIANRRADAVSQADGKGLFMFEAFRGLGQQRDANFNGKKLVKSSQISNTRGTGAQTYILTGYFPDWVVARLGIFEFMVDPYTAMQSLITYIQAVQYIDAGPRHAASFVLADGVNIS